MASTPHSGTTQEKGTTVKVNPNTRYSVSATNWQQWTRTIKVDVDGDVQSFSVPKQSVAGKFFQTKTGTITVWLYDSQDEYMEATDVKTVNEAQAYSASFAAKKAGNDVHAGESTFSDVSVNVNWYV